ncbi:MAG: hypothetical protein OEV78_09165 [Spirochaetia bacterium]|nr:hypothetical protein [Spirochaetia bacterium]
MSVFALPYHKTEAMMAMRETLSQGKLLVSASLPSAIKASNQSGFTTLDAQSLYHRANALLTKSNLWGIHQSMKNLKENTMKLKKIITVTIIAFAAFGIWQCTKPVTTTATTTKGTVNLILQKAI